jgi:hypothetical protein
MREEFYHNLRFGRRTRPSADPGCAGSRAATGTATSSPGARGPAAAVSHHLRPLLRQLEERRVSQDPPQRHHLAAKAEVPKDAPSTLLHHEEIDKVSPMPGGDKPIRR